MEETFLRADGVVLWRPDEKTRKGLTRSGGHIISTGQLCTACLVGDWGMTLLKQRKVLCDDCSSLDAELRDLTGEGLESPQIIVAPTPRGDLAEARVRAAKEYRAELLAPVFAAARAAGVVALTEAQHPGEPPFELVGQGDLNRLGLIPSSYEDRVPRYARWLQALDPDAYARRAEHLADVEGWATWLRERDAQIRKDRARRELDRAVQDAARAPKAVLDAVVRTIRADRPTR